MTALYSVRLLVGAAALGLGAVGCQSLPDPDFTTSPATSSLRQLPDAGPIDAIAKVRADRLGAKRRKEAVEAMRDVDCNYWPEAEDALVAALRTDRNEAVRYTAARTLASGKCGTKKTIEALSVCTSGSDRDGAPGEVSQAVRAAAAKSLASHCFHRGGAQLAERPTGEPVTPAVAKSGPPGNEVGGAAPRESFQAYYAKVRQRPTEAVLATARDVLAWVSFPPGADDIPAGNIDFTVVALFPDPSRTVAPARREPTRAANISGLLASPGSAPAPTAEQRRASSGAVRPAVYVERLPDPTVTVEREPQH
jgi:hypothetical protein